MGQGGGNHLPSSPRDLQWIIIIALLEHSYSKVFIIIDYADLGPPEQLKVGDMSVGGFSAVIAVVLSLGVVAGIVGTAVAAVITRQYFKNRERVTPSEEAPQETNSMEETIIT